jgi:hypothetical protein
MKPLIGIKVVQHFGQKTRVEPDLHVVTLMQVNRSFRPYCHNRCPAEISQFGTGYF